MNNDLFDDKQLDRLQRLAGDRFPDVVNSFENDINVILPRIKLAAKNNNTQELFDAIHALKSVSGNLAARNMKQYCELLEKQMHENKLSDTKPHVDKIETETALIIKTLREMC